MPVHLSFQHAGDHLRFELTGSRGEGDQVGEMLATWRQVAEQCRALGLARVLGVSHVAGAASAADMFRLASELPAILAGGVRKVAFVALGGDEALRSNLFGENVAVNRGVNGRVFDDEAKALEWLRAG